MRSFLPVWMLLLSVLCFPALAQDDEDPLFGEEPAAETPADEASAEDPPAEETPPKAAAEEAASDAGDDLFGESEPTTKEASPEAEKPTRPAREPHSHEEIKAELLKQNPLIVQQMAKFIELNKQVMKQAVTSGNKEELMPILREYGPAVIRTKQLWTTIAGNPAKYDTWLGSPDYRKAWGAFHHNFASLYGYTERFAAVDVELADKVSDGLMALGTSFDDYNAWVDEWDAEIGNDAHSFARGDDRLNELNEEQMREEEGADSEVEKAAADQTQEEEDETAPSEVEEAQEDTEETDKEIFSGEEKSADEAADETVEDEEMQEEEAVEGEGSEESPAEESPVDEEIDFGEG